MSADYIMTAMTGPYGEQRELDLSAAFAASPKAAAYLLAQLRALAGPVGDAMLPKAPAP